MRCWACGAPYDAHTGLSGASTPTSGDASVCLYCACVGTYDTVGKSATLCIRQPTDEELLCFLDDDRVLSARQLIQQGLDDGTLSRWRGDRRSGRDRRQMKRERRSL